MGNNPNPLSTVNIELNGHTQTLQDWLINQKKYIYNDTVCYICGKPIMKKQDDNFIDWKQTILFALNKAKNDLKEN